MKHSYIICCAVTLSLLAGCTDLTIPIPSPVTYDGNRAGSGSVPVDNEQYARGDTVTVRENTGSLVRKGWNFMGWARTQEATTVDYRAGATFLFTGRLILYAVWEGKGYTINFDDNGGTGGTQADQRAVFGTPVTLPATTTFTPPPRLTFGGWAKSPTGAVIQGTYNPDTYKNPTTLYAVWGDAFYTISFDDNGGTGGTQADRRAVFGTSVTLPAPTTFTPPLAKQFEGWAKSSTGAVIQGTYNPDTYSPTITLYARWEDKPIAGNKWWNSIAMSFDGEKLAAGEGGSAGGHIYTSTDYGVTWKDRSTGTIAGNKWWRSIAMSSTGEKLAAVVGGSSGDGRHLYTSWNSGETWTNRSTGAISGNKNWHSIAMSDDGQRLAAVVNGGHIYTSSNSGETWTNRSSGTIAGNKEWRSIAMSSDGRYLAAVVWGDHIYTSTDYGVNWTNRSSGTIAGNKEWSSIAMSSDGRYLAAVAGGGHIYTSTDYGVNWKNRGTIAGDTNWLHIAMSSDGQQLAAVVWGGHIYTSSNRGATWRDRSSGIISGNKNWYSIAMSDDGQQLAAGEWLGHLYTSSNRGTTWEDRSR